MQKPEHFGPDEIKYRGVSTGVLKETSVIENKNMQFLHLNPSLYSSMEI